MATKVNEVTDIWSGFKRGFRGFGANIAVIINTALLGLVYLIGVSISSIYAKLTGISLLEMRLSKKSYWAKYQKPANHYRQF